nr:reverse transcriptase domain-containing protein [Tanacetum cinerariifolium]
MGFEISFTDALFLMPKFASTLKALIGYKEKLSEMARITMNEHCSAVILNKLPRKLGDPGKFLIPCEFSGMDECLALADLGASINLMPLSVWEGVSPPELTPTCMTLELADRSVSKLIGIAKDVSFKVGVFHFPADFMVVDFEPDPRVPLILGRLGTLPGNTITNTKEELKVAPVSAPMPNLKPSIPYPSRRDNEKCHDQANEQIKKFYKIFKEMSFEIKFTNALILMPKFASTLKALIENKEKLCEMARTTMNEHCSAVILNKLPRKLGDPRKFLIPCEFSGMDECLALADLGASINLMPLSVWEGLLLPELTPTCMTLELVDRLVSKPIGIAKDVSFKVGIFHFPVDFVVVDFEPDPRVPLILGSDFLLFEEADAFLGLEDDPDSPKINPFYYDLEGDIFLLEAILNNEPSPPLPNQEQICLRVELKDLPHYLEYAFLEGDNKLPVIIAKELGSEEQAALIKVLKSHKRAIAWKLYDIQGINPEFCTHKILMEEDYKPAVQHQRRVNPKIHDVIKKEVEKLLDAGLIYPIFDSP